MKKNKKPNLILHIALAASLVAIGITADAVTGHYWDVIAAAFSDTESAIDDDLLTEAQTESKDISVKLLQEGAVLLKNDNDTLPLSKSVTKVNTYGVLSAHIYPNGSGSGAISNSADEVVDLKEALNDEGIEVNSKLWNYESKQDIDGSKSNVKENGSVVVVNEMDVASYDKEVPFTEAKDYSEYAVVTFGRMFSEGSDASHGQLTLTSNELALLKHLDANGFKIIALVNSSNVMEIGALETYADAILWIGGPGTYGMDGVADILVGNVSPSGRTVDTWMYDSTTSSSYYTAENYTYSNASRGYTNYNEGIYVGYRWYETADAEGYFSSVSNSYGSGYNGVVTYPFGYGLSYADFQEEITSVEQKDNQLIFSVKTTNTTDVSAKDTFELYVEKPYTDGGVEVSKVELVGLAKSDEIKNSSYETTITVSLDDLASYDEDANEGEGAYVLAGGEYKFYLAGGSQGSHVWKNASSAQTYSVTLSEKTDRDSDVIKAKNQLQSGENDNYIGIDDDNAGFKELSRANHFANASQTISKSANEGKTVKLDTDSVAYSALTDKNYYQAYDANNVTISSNTLVEQKAKYTLSDMYTKDENGNPLFSYDYKTKTKTMLSGVSFDDSRWDYLISQMSVDEMQKLLGNAGYMTAKIDSISKAKMVDYDGPFGLNNYMKSSLGIQSKCTSFCSEVVMASTWNTELIEDLGKAIGKEANATGQVGWYAPGANIHRTIYGGRNAEYFSEDSYLSGIMASYEAGGALSTGLYCYAKHFAFNDIEANRTSGENCYMSEQTAREIYLKAFEIGIKDNNILGLMDSYMWVCGEWLGGNCSLITNIVRGEWGFNGVITTDNAGGSGDVSSWLTVAKNIYAGGDLVLNVTAMKLPTEVKTSDAGISAMKRSTKHVLYAVSVANSQRLREAKVGTNKFIPIYVSVNVVLYGGAAALLLAYILRYFKYKKRSEPKEEQKGN